MIDIFGTSIDDVPKKVRSAICLSDYGQGKPLTARRILAVNKAVDAELKALAKQFGITGGAAGQIASIVAKDSGLSNGEALGGSEGAVAREMLAANAALRERQGPILGQDPETRAFGAIRSIPLPVAEPDVLLEAVGDLVKTAASWRERLGTAPDATSPLT